MSECESSVREVKPVFYVFVGGMGPRAGSHLYDHFHRHLENILGRTPYDNEYPESLLLTLPQQEGGKFTGNFTVDTTMLEGLSDFLRKQGKNTVFVPLCVSVSHVFEELFPPDRVRTIASFIRENYPQQTVYCSQESAQMRELGDRTYVDVTEAISNFTDMHEIPPGVLACTELSLCAHGDDIIDAPKLFMEQLMEEYYANSR